MPSRTDTTLPVAPTPSELEALRAHAGEAAALLKALSNENRLLIVCALASREMSVGELNERVDLSQSGLSQQLAVLRRDGIVANRRDSQTIYYRLAPSKALHIINTLKDTFCGTEQP